MNQKTMCRKRKRNSDTPIEKESTGKARTKKITVACKSSPSPRRSPKKALSKESKADEVSDTSQKVFSRKKKNEKVGKVINSDKNYFQGKIYLGRSN